MTAWLSVDEVARILPSAPDPRHVRRMAKRAESGEIEWQTRRVRRGFNAASIEISLDSLGPEAIARYYQHVADSSRPAQAAPPAAPRCTTLRSFITASTRQQLDAGARHAAVLAYEQFLERHGSRRGLALARKRWCAAYNAGLERERRQALESGREHPSIERVSLGSIERWRRAYNDAGRNIDALVDGNDGSGRRGATSIPEVIAREFETLYLRATKPSVAQCYKRLKKLRRARGWEKLPGYHSFWRYAEGPDAKIPAAVRSYYREPDRRRENLRPFVERDFSDPEFRAMQIIQSDHHQIDVAVACGDPFCKVGHYPWITAWLDLRSRRVLAIEVYIECPNSRRILSTLQRLIEDFGVPSYVYVDNGADYVRSVGRWSVKHFEVGRRAAKNVEVAGWTPDLVERIAGPFGMEAIFSTEGNPQSKLIERWFLTLKEALYREFESYRGALGERTERAEYLRTHPEELPALLDFAVAVQRSVDDYNATPHRGAGMDGRSPIEVFESTRIQPIRKADPAALAQAFWAEKIGAKVQRQGIKHHHLWYVLPTQAQVEYFGRKVNIRYDEGSPETIVLYDAAGRFIAIATARTKAPQRRGAPEVAGAIEGRNREWREIQAYIRERFPKDAKRLEAINADIATYEALLARECASAVPAAAAAAGGVVTVVDSHLSTLARQVQSAREQLASEIVRLTDEERAIARTAEDHTDAFLGRLRVVPDLPDDDDEIDLAAELARAAARRLERDRRACDDCRAGIPCSAPHALPLTGAADERRDDDSDRD
ncbi:MAG: Mu transposase C-terminal domain-containing protein [Thermoanaerobaculia bacterium]